ncbi:hypothetical protein K503DRAFT_543432 [Rhizopogon vinicolor AM-OR11-026]|uniref:Secreted protein n=1 Tax=Rhizopogon vinicolor AM-OR11-026 TaxID=1314800 RepID=A0A1B7NGU1_9AGAM|nr:hypothetical protein K503DRAFT_543432 [Rhizopogon vinicolor AM-OR11-026]
MLPPSWRLHGQHFVYLWIMGVAPAIAADRIRANTTTVPARARMGVLFRWSKNSKGVWRTAATRVACMFRSAGRNIIEDISHLIRDEVGAT